MYRRSGGGSVLYIRPRCVPYFSARFAIISHARRACFGKRHIPLWVTFGREKLGFGPVWRHSGATRQTAGDQAHPEQTPHRPTAHEQQSRSRSMRKLEGSWPFTRRILEPRPAGSEEAAAYRQADLRAAARPTRLPGWQGREERRGSGLLIFVLKMSHRVRSGACNRQRQIGEIPRHRATRRGIASLRRTGDASIAKSMLPCMVSQR